LCARDGDPAAQHGGRLAGQVLRELSDDEIKWKTNGTAQYQELAVRSMQTMRETEALTAPEPDRKRIAWDSAPPLLHKNASA
jgi:phenylacetic acid degradation protein